MTNLAWCDTETNGLFPHTCHLLELALAVTTPQLEIIATQSWILLQAEALEKLLESTPERVQKMHLDNGLWADILAGKYNPNAEAEACAFLDKHGCCGVQPDGKTYRSPLCGNSVGFDRSFLKAKMPTLERKFHYRNIDVSSIKELVDRWFVPGMQYNPGTDARHRALDDIKNSIRQLRHYKAKVFNPHARVSL